MIVIGKENIQAFFCSWSHICSTNGLMGFFLVYMYVLPTECMCWLLSCWCIHKWSGIKVGRLRNPQFCTHHPHIKKPPIVINFKGSSCILLIFHEQLRLIVIILVVSFVVVCEGMTLKLNLLSRYQKKIFTLYVEINCLGSIFNIRGEMKLFFFNFVMSWWDGFPIRICG